MGHPCAPVDLGGHGSPLVSWRDKQGRKASTDSCSTSRGNDEEFRRWIGICWLTLLPQQIDLSGSAKFVFVCSFSLLCFSVAILCHGIDTNFCTISSMYSFYSSSQSNFIAMLDGWL